MSLSWGLRQWLPASPITEIGTTVKTSGEGRTHRHRAPDSALAARRRLVPGDPVARALACGQLLSPARVSLMTSGKVPLSAQQANDQPPSQLDLIGYGPEVRIVGDQIVISHAVGGPGRSAFSKRSRTSATQRELPRGAGFAVECQFQPRHLSPVALGSALPSPMLISARAPGSPGRPLGSVLSSAGHPLMITQTGRCYDNNIPIQGGLGLLLESRRYPGQFNRMEQRGHRYPGRSQSEAGVRQRPV